MFLFVVEFWMLWHVEGCATHIFVYNEIVAHSGEEIQ
jgi:hypothetical protein